MKKVVKIKKTEALEILELLYAFYPNFNKNKMNNFNQIWINRLCEGDYEKTLRKAEAYTAESPFPPALADILVKEYVPHDDHMAESIRESEEIVRQEKADPETAARRKKKLDEMNEKLKRLNAYD